MNSTTAGADNGSALRHGSPDAGSADPTDHASDHTSDHPAETDGEPIIPPRLRVVGGGEVAIALAQLATVLRWSCVICERVEAGDDLDDTDAIVVLSHDLEVAGTALCRGLAGSIGYVGGMGSSTTQRLRREWLLNRRIEPQRIDRIHGPAGLDIGASDPGEIALAIIAEIAAVRHGAAGGMLVATRR